jgi:hypothetical protein
MCEDCPAEARDLADRIAAYITARNHVIAGGLHIVIEDENVSDEHIKWCLGTQDLDAEARQIAAGLLAMPLPHRHVTVQWAWDDRERESWKDT